MKKFIKLLLCSLMCFSLFGCDSDEVKEAKEGFNAQVDRIESEKASLDETLTSANELLNNHETPLYESTITDLQEAVTEAEDYTVDIPDVPKEAEDIDKATDELKELGYTDIEENVQSKIDALNESIAQLKQVTQPSEDFVLSRVRSVSGVEEAQPVTEDNDPNGQLNKAKGYTACIYFAYEKVPDDYAYGSDIIEKGTDNGGAIEVYANEDDANSRNEYLAAFDGGALASGSHTVLGTCVVRTSNGLTATQQNELEEALIAALIEIKD